MKGSTRFLDSVLNGIVELSDWKFLLVMILGTVVVVFTILAIATYLEPGSFSAPSGDEITRKERRAEMVEAYP